MVTQIVVMGVSGCGKSTLARALAAALDGRFIEGDDYHAAASAAKMRSGVALNDADREQWLDRLGEALHEDEGVAVLSCSALKLRYRDRMRAATAGLAFVYLEISLSEAMARVAQRPAHFFPASLVEDQFANLEVPLGEARVLRVPAGNQVEHSVAVIKHWLASCEQVDLLHRIPD
ncbi:gluconokinase [Paraburkholderia bannensis]|uniref:gluconokinase n=1 Tax=Paraburkholderia bannensis TaxID=765414 RepID=UPI002AC3719A|nr:gluconokinase, GntK/IdnK-type [Paraburkholderia bannensis]